MSGVPKRGSEQENAPTHEEIQARIGKRLDDVAKILAGALVAVAGVMTLLGLSSDVVFVALNNESWPVYVASLCAILAIVCSIVEDPSRRLDLYECHLTASPRGKGPGAVDALLRISLHSGRNG